MNNEKLLEDRDIICFGSSTWDYPGFQQTAMKYFSGLNRIFFVNPIGTRKIKLSLYDLKKCFAKAKGMLKENNEGFLNSTIHSPKILPFIYNPFIERINHIMMKMQIVNKLSKLRFNNYILWIGTPTAYFINDILNPIFTIYNPVDRFSEFPFVDGVKIKRFEQRIAINSDIILCTSDAIGEDMSRFNSRTHVIHHWVDTQHFEKALNDDWIPEDLRPIPRPVFGYYGTTASGRLDLDLLKDLARRHPQAHVVIIGSKPEMDVGLQEQPNIHFLGSKPFELIPYYLKQFTVCLIPFLINDLTRAIDPIKLREYLALGKPVVSVDLPEVRKLGDLVYIANDRADFLVKAGVALGEESSANAQRRIAEARRNDSGIRLKELSRWLAGIVPVAIKGMATTDAQLAEESGA